jgi:hypothetical protein
MDLHTERRVEADSYGKGSMAFARSGGTYGDGDLVRLLGMEVEMDVNMIGGL